MGGAASHYGRSQDEWDLLVEKATAFLMERAGMRRLTSYTELNAVLQGRTGLRGFDFERADERAAMGHLLGLVVDATYPDTHVMLSALVNYLGANEPGPGFYALAQAYGLLPPRASSEAKERFWLGQVKAAHELYTRDA